MNQELKVRILAGLLPYDPVWIGVFGSYARGENAEESDLDILIRFKHGISLLRLVQIEQELSDALGIKIDLVTENSLKNPRLKAAIAKDLISIYE
jgi:uncharacterized protein